VRLDADEIADSPDIRMGAGCSDTECARPRGVEASVLSDWVLRATTLNFERPGVLNERRDAKMVH
jgi:hypothetical protein